MIVNKRRINLVLYHKENFVSLIIIKQALRQKTYHEETPCIECSRCSYQGFKHIN